MHPPYPPPPRLLVPRVIQVQGRCPVEDLPHSPLPCTFRLQDNANASPGALRAGCSPSCGPGCTGSWQVPPSAGTAGFPSLLRYLMPLPSLSAPALAPHWVRQTGAVLSSHREPYLHPHLTLCLSSFWGSEAQSPPLCPGMRLGQSQRRGRSVASTLVQCPPF